MEKRLANDNRGEPLVLASIGHIIHSRGLVNVRELARENFLSGRQFERNFKEFSDRNSSPDDISPLKNESEVC